MRTGHQENGPIRYPAIGASLSKALATGDEELPNFVSISPSRAFNQAAYGPGFLGPRYAPLTVGAANGAATPTNSDAYAKLRVDDLEPLVSKPQLQQRMRMWRALQGRFMRERHLPATIAHDTVYAKAVRLMNSEAAQAFDLSSEPDTVREAYGKGRFGQGCLMARRLIEQGVPFVEVSLLQAGNNSFGWDTHTNNFSAVRSLSEQLDKGWSTLMKELEARGLLERTTILWMGEFGRTPKINDNAGRDHFPAAWTCVFAGGGIQGGQVYGATNESGMEVTEGKVNEADVLATLSQALGVNPETENISALGRPIKIAEGNVIEELLS